MPPQDAAASAAAGAFSAQSGSTAKHRMALQGERPSVGAGQPAVSLPVTVSSDLLPPGSGAPRAPVGDAGSLFEYRACRRDSAVSKYSC